MINILIADDNSNFVNLIFKKVIRNNNQYRLTDYVYDGENTLNSILKYKPDVILLDINMPKKDGLHIIDYIISNKIDYLPYIIVISGATEYIYKLHNNNNIYAVINKGIGFNEMINELKKYLEEINSHIFNDKLYKCIKKELEIFDLNFSNQGTKYLIDSILFAYGKDTINLSKDIFPKISKKYNVKPINVKWNIEKNIKAMKRYTNDNIITEYFNIDINENLTTKKVITSILNKIIFKYNIS